MHTIVTHPNDTTTERRKAAYDEINNAQIAQLRVRRLTECVDNLHDELTAAIAGEAEQHQGNPEWEGDYFPARANDHYARACHLLHELGRYVEEVEMAARIAVRQ